MYSSVDYREAACDGLAGPKARAASMVGAPVATYLRIRNLRGWAEGQEAAQRPGLARAIVRVFCTLTALALCKTALAYGHPPDTKSIDIWKLPWLVIVGSMAGVCLAPCLALLIAMARLRRREMVERWRVRWTCGVGAAASVGVGLVLLDLIVGEGTCITVLKAARVVSVVPVVAAVVATVTDAYVSRQTAETVLPHESAGWRGALWASGLGMAASGVASCILIGLIWASGWFPEPTAVRVLSLILVVGAVGVTVTAVRAVSQGPDVLLRRDNVAWRWAIWASVVAVGVRAAWLCVRALLPVTYDYVWSDAPVRMLSLLVVVAGVWMGVRVVRACSPPGSAPEKAEPEAVGKEQGSTTSGRSAAGDSRARPARSGGMSVAAGKRKDRGAWLESVDRRHRRLMLGCLPIVVVAAVLLDLSSGSRTPRYLGIDQAIRDLLLTLMFVVLIGGGAIWLIVATVLLHREAREREELLRDDD